MVPYSTCGKVTQTIVIMTTKVLIFRTEHHNYFVPTKYNNFD